MPSTAELIEAAQNPAGEMREYCPVFANALALEALLA